MIHLTEEQFQRLTDGNLEAEQSEALWHHLNGCEVCLDRLNQRLEGQNMFLGNLEDTVISNTFQRKLMQRINREEATRAFLSFSYHGLSSVFYLLIKTSRAVGSKMTPSTTVEVEEK